jgi:urease accessory protein
MTMNSAPSTPEGAGWQARLNLSFVRRGEQTCSTYTHEGPLRVLQALYPEGPGVCHHVLIHPPGGLVGGDQIDLSVQVAEGAHAFVTTPGATRFYRSTGADAIQRVKMALAPNARLEWLPLETIAYDECRAHNHWTVSMAPGAQLMAWDVLALGLPQSGQPYQFGRYRQHFEIEGVWLERGTVDGADKRWMDGPVGLSGNRCLATLVLASGSDLSKDQQERALELARGVEAGSGTWLGVTCPHARVVVARVLAQQTEPAMALLQQIWARWRDGLWGLSPMASRMWRV